MRTMCFVTAVILGFAVAARAEETPAKSRIVSASLFKNGLAVIEREVTVNGPGAYRLEDVPEPVHGTYWVESDARVESSVRNRDVDVPAEAIGGNLQEELAGKKMTVYFRSEKLPPLKGTVVPLPRKHHEAFGISPAFRGAEYGYQTPPESASRFLILQTVKGRAYVEPGDIAYYEAEGVAETVRRHRPVLVLNVSPAGKQAIRIRIRYLAHGLSWAPSYRIDVSDPKRLAVEQSAVIKNEMTDLKEADISLISGFPSVQFAHVISPLSVRTSWALFFQQLGQRPGEAQASMMNSVMGQAAMPGYGGGGIAPVPVLPGREGIDLYYHPIGRRTLSLGDALVLTTGKGQADYERVVEWLIPDHRDEFGNPHRQPSVDSETGEATGDAWDALIYKNPLPFPMTTGPASVVSQGHFNGQRLSGWVNAGEETTLRVNKALSLRTGSMEHEDHNGNGIAERDVIDIGGRRFRRAVVRGEVKLCNHRSEPIHLRIHRRFSGDLLKADGEPKVELLEEGVYAANKRNELVWKFLIKPGEEKTLTYQYSVLVSF